MRPEHRLNKQIGILDGNDFEASRDDTECVLLHSPTLYRAFSS